MTRINGLGYLNWFEFASDWMAAIDGLASLSRFFTAWLKAAKSFRCSS